MRFGLFRLTQLLELKIKKTRPAIIINDNTLGKLPLKVIVPITDWKDKYSVAPWMVKIVPDKQNMLTKDSSADCFQIRSVAEERCIKKLGQVEKNIMDKIRKAIATVLNIE